MMGNRTAGCLDLAGGKPSRFQRLQAKITKGNRVG
jgi:hypothetical protein